jgi:hypothetical protein
MLKSVQYVRVMPDFKAVVVACRQFFFALLICLDAVKSAFDSSVGKSLTQCSGLINFFNTA